MKRKSKYKHQRAKFIAYKTIQLLNKMVKAWIMKESEEKSDRKDMRGS